MVLNCGVADEVGCNLCLHVVGVRVKETGKIKSTCKSFLRYDTHKLPLISQVYFCTLVAPCPVFPRRSSISNEQTIIISLIFSQVPHLVTFLNHAQNGTLS